MSCIVVLCVILLLSQVEMLPLSQESTHSAMDGLSSPLKMTPVIRVKRTVIGFSGCPQDMVKLWHHGPCVTCDEYMEHRNVDDCPSNR